MSTFTDILLWAGLLAGSLGLVWLYGSSWRAVARALAEAAELDAGLAPGQAEGSIVSQPEDGDAPACSATVAVGDSPAPVAGTPAR